MVHRKLFQYLSTSLNWTAHIFMPILPLLLAMVLMDTRYVRHYKVWLEKLKLHFKELNKGPVEHFLSDVFLRHQKIPVDIKGECVQCGNCCLNKKCAFLERISDEKFQCGIYSSRLRKFSNCSSFPLHAIDIERYACPSYTVVQTSKVIWAEKMPSQNLVDARN